MRYYHISYQDHGKEVLLKPRVPESTLKGEDNKTPRICVAPRVADCFRLFSWQDYRDKVYVYECKIPRATYYPIRAEGKVPDWEHAKKEEYWLTKPTYFKKVGFARMYRILSVLGKGNCRFWAWVGKDIAPGDRECDDEYRLWGDALKQARKMAIDMKIATRQVARDWGKQMKKGVLSWK